MNEDIVNIGMYITYGLLALAIATSVIFPIIHFIKDFKKAIGTLVGLGILVGVVLFAFLISSGEAHNSVSELTSRWVSAGINSVFILAGLAIVAAVTTEVAKIFNK